ncbi:hypothetical protein thsrh120_22850 [Rhizobium sp. No.120]
MIEGIKQFAWPLQCPILTLDENVGYRAYCLAPELISIVPGLPDATECHDEVAVAIEISDFVHGAAGMALCCRATAVDRHKAYAEAVQ